jgi:hypothetical protein
MTISIEQARQILGKRAEDFSDEEIRQVLEYLYSLANSIYDNL